MCLGFALLKISHRPGFSGFPTTQALRDGRFALSSAREDAAGWKACVAAQGPQPMYPQPMPLGRNPALLLISFPTSASASSSCFGLLWTTLRPSSTAPPTAQCRSAWLENFEGPQECLEGLEHPVQHALSSFLLLNLPTPLKRCGGAEPTRHVLLGARLAGRDSDRDFPPMLL